jgi:hypothetical protein
MLRKALPVLVAAASLARPVLAQTADEVIAMANQARGGLDKLQALQSVRMKGRMAMGPGFEVPVTIEMKRPRNTRMDFALQGTTAVQAFDGQVAWGILPGGQKAEPLPPEMARSLENQADIGGPLVDYKARGHAVELVGKEPVGAGEAWKLKLTLKGGEVQYVFVDTASHLQVRNESRRTTGGAEIEIVTTLGDYKSVGGVLWPHSIESGARGRPEKQSLVFDSIEVNVEIDDARFRMPAAAPAAPPGAARPN